MKSTRIHKTIATFTIAGAMFVGATVTASAEPVAKVTKGQLAASCKASGGGSYGRKGVYGCTTSNSDGSSDSTECTKKGCNHYHFEPGGAMLVGHGSKVRLPGTGLVTRAG